jgi:hypothetical protein
MQIDTEHLHHWMQAIRQSPDPMRTMDAFWRGQITSKEWLIKNLCGLITEPVTVEIHGGWVGVLSSMLFQSDIPITSITSIDIDPDCKPVASMMNKQEEIQGRFQAAIADMTTYRSSADVIINTSCEHITQEDYDQWLSGIPHTSLIVLQSNNFFIDEHIRPALDLEEFMEQSHLDVIKFGELPTEKYRRFMLIGRPSV